MVNVKNDYYFRTVDCNMFFRNRIYLDFFKIFKWSGALHSA